MPSSTSSETARLLSRLSLWPRQRKAVAGIRDYIKAFRAGSTTGSALVHMPTGSGKTAVIATLARCLPEVDCVLLLAPREALRDQLALAVHHRFFDNLVRSPREIPKRVLKLPGSNLAVEISRNGRGSRIPIASLVGEELQGTVVVMTDQMLHSLRRAGDKTTGEKERRDFFAALERKVSLLLIDEGHYEPALAWGATIRRFDVPRVLFTATPFRNDLKSFDVDYGHVETYSLQKATGDNFIRGVTIVPRPSPTSPIAFIDDVLDFYQKTLLPLSPQSRVIIRCESAEKIRQMAKVLKDRGRDYVAIHERFSPSTWPKRERKSVPDREWEPEWYGEQGPTFWIHQFKLLEGIDDPRFQLLALYDPLTNVRAFVQQVGRVLRNPEYPRPGTAFVLDHSGGDHDRVWSNFLTFDRDIQKRGGPPRPLGDVVFETLQAALPDPAYVDGSFRARFDFKAIELRRDIRVPLTVNLLEHGRHFKLSQLVDLFARHLQEEDRVFRKYEIDNKTVVFIHFSVSHTPFLSETYFLNCSLDLAVIHQMKDYTAFYDSAGFLPVRLEQQGIGRPLGGPGLRRLFRQGEGTRLVEVALKNSQLGNRAVRSRSFTAASVESTVPALDDPAQIVTRVTGYSNEVLNSRQPRGGKSDPKSVLIRRYVGFRNGRVADSRSEVGLEDYLTWVQQLVVYAKGGDPPLASFARYAPDSVDVSDATPINVLLDLFEVQDDFVTVGDEELKLQPGEAMQVEDLCQTVEATTDEETGAKRFGFSLAANNSPARVFIAYNSKLGRYGLESADLDRRYRRARGVGKGLVAYLNQEQSFRVIPASRDAIYVDGAFYRPIVELGSKFDPDRYHVGKILESVEILRKTGSEKGRTCDEDDWDASSLFGLISRCGAEDERLQQAFGDPDVLVCDDPGKEVADFILADPPDRVGRRVVFVHAKGSKFVSTEAKYRYRPYSASALSEVCAQAIKNIRYLSMFNELLPPNLDSWGKAWSVPGVAGTVPRRIRRSPVGHEDPLALWQLLMRRITDPSTYREVWLFLGMTLSKSELERQLRLEKPAPEAIQALVLLHGTMAAVGSIDAKLRVFCSP